MRLITAAILSAYAAILFRVLVFKNLFFHIGHLRFRLAAKTGENNFIPLRTILADLHGGAHFGVVNLVGNIVLFAPIGLLVPLVFRGLTWRWSLAVAVGLAFEGTELVFRVGEFDIDDLILNAVGVMLGYAVFRLLERWRRAWPITAGAQ